MANTTLIVMAGLPGSGKSTVANELARRLTAPVLSIDPIEAAMWRSQISRQMTGIAAYEIAAAIAEENLKIGISVIIDAVNPVKAARSTWVQLSERQNVRLQFIECSCSDISVHRQRIEARVRNIPGMPEIPWSRVEERKAEYEQWDFDHVTFDTASMSPDAIVADLMQRFR